MEDPFENAAPLNVALLGYGFAGKTFHAPLLAARARIAPHSHRFERCAKVKKDWDVTVLREAGGRLRSSGN